MDGLKMVALAGSIASALIGTLYAAADAGRDDAPAAVAVSPTAPEALAPPAPMQPLTPMQPLPAGADVDPEAAALVDLEPGEIIDLETGVRMGPLTVLRRPEPEPETVEPEPVETHTPRATRRPPTPVYPRMSADPGRNVILVARRMMAEHQVVQGSCYRYVSEVFERAGHVGWRSRSTVFHAGRNGPYANLDLIRPGDWLYIVNHPERSPVGTHSVIFVSWIDRSRGYAEVIEHSGWGAPSAGQERGYDVSRTYRIIRAR